MYCQSTSSFSLYAIQFEEKNIMCVLQKAAVNKRQEDLGAAAWPPLTTGNNIKPNTKEIQNKKKQ